MKRLAAPRGTADHFPPESARWLAAEGRLRALARRYGYGEIRTPIFEATELFVRSVGEATDIVDKEMYSFVDKGGRSITLRPELTAPVVRAVLEHGLLAGGALRLSYLGPIFRYERPQAGRLRQAHQFGIECFGFFEPEADLEAIALAAHALADAGIAPRLQLGSIGDAACRPRYRELLVAYLAEHRDALSPESQERLARNPLRILDSKAPQDRAVIAAAPTMLELLCEPCREHFARLQSLLAQAGIAYIVDPTLVRGLDYYTRTVFEFVADGLGAQSTVCAGGRYDELVASLGGPPTPAVGFALGLERLLLASAAAGESAATGDGIAVVPLGAAARERALTLVAALRRTEDAPPVAIDYREAKVALHLKRADAVGARAALILGDEELARGEIVLRDLRAREQRALALPADPALAACEIVRAYRALAA